MQNIGIIEAIGNGKARVNPILRLIGKNKLQPSRVATIKSVVDDIPASFDAEERYDTEADETELKDKFIAALVAHNGTLASLTLVVVDMLAQGVERNEAIEWGLESGLSESYVRSTVSSIYIQLTGQREKAVGGGRKRNNGAAEFAERAMKASKDDVAAAKALLLAARRLLEQWEAAGTVEAELASIRNK